MTVDEPVPDQVLEENVRRLFEQVKSGRPAPATARDRILGRLLQETSPRRGLRTVLAARSFRWVGLAAALFVAAALLTSDRQPTKRGSVSFAIHLLAAGPGSGVVEASTLQGGEPVRIHSERQVSNADVESARVARNGSGCQVDIRLTREGTGKLARLTRDHVGERLALVIDGKVVMTPTVRSEITQGEVALTGAFTDARCEEIARGLSVRSQPAS